LVTGPSKKRGAMRNPGKRSRELGGSDGDDEMASMPDSNSPNCTGTAVKTRLVVDWAGATSDFRA
jgi:hypothetical protein